MRLFKIIFTLAVGLTATQANAQNPLPFSKGNTMKTSAIAWPICAPNDGPGIEIHIAPNDNFDCADNNSPHKLVRIYQPWSQIQKQSSPIMLEKMIGNLADCPGGDRPCTNIDHANIQIDAKNSPETGVLVMPMSVMNGMTKSFNFTVKWCDRPTPVCG